MTISKAEVREANACPQWKEFRKSLNGWSIDRRLYWMREYLRPQNWEQARAQDALTIKVRGYKECCNYNVRAVQVLEWLRRLARSGHIENVPRTFQYKDKVENYLHKLLSERGML